MQRALFESRHQKMTEQAIGPLILQFAAPTAVGMLVISLYSIADAFFVSRLGTEAAAAVGVSFAIQSLFQAVGYTLGMGAGSLMSQRLGEKKQEAAAFFARFAFFLSLLIGLLLMGIGLLFAGPIVRLLGATESIYPYALSYVRPLFWASPFMCATFVLSQLLRAEGKAVYSMVGLLIGSLLNILLDWLFIGGIKMGISGASLATLISQAVGMAVLLSAYLFGKSQIALLKLPKSEKKTDIARILVTGLPSTFRQGLITLSTVLLNRAAGLWSDAAVTAISGVTRLFLLAFSICLGVGQGMMPVVGYNYGYRRYDRVKKAYLISLLASGLGMLLLAIPSYLLAGKLIALFDRDPAVIAIGAGALRAQSLVFVLHGCVTCTIMLLQAVGKPLPATALACARQGIFFFPLLFLLPSAFGLEALIYVQPLADALTFLFSLFFVAYAIKKVLPQKHGGNTD